MKTTIDKAELKKQIIYNVKTLYRRTIDEATPQQVFQAVSPLLPDPSGDRLSGNVSCDDRKLYDCYCQRSWR